MKIIFITFLCFSYLFFIVSMNVIHNKKLKQIKLERQKYEDKKVADSEIRKLRELRISDARVLQLYIMYDEDRRYLFDPYGSLNENGVGARLYVNRHCGFIVMETSNFCRYINSLRSFYAKDKSPAKVIIKEKRASKDKDLELIKAGKACRRLKKKKLMG